MEAEECPDCGHDLDELDWEIGTCPWCGADLDENDHD